MLSRQVTGLDARTATEFRQVPFSSAQSYSDIRAFAQRWETGNLLPLKRSWWYAWHCFGSRAECIYAPHAELYEWDRRFDVVIAGAIIEHLSDPVFSIGAWSRIAREAVIVPWTDIMASDELFMQPMTSWEDPLFNYAWWQLSEGLWRRVFDNVGFDVTWRESHAVHTMHSDQVVTRPVIIATRR
jgi:hypothetical protein